MTVIELVGYVASALVVASFTMKNMLLLRYMALLSNFAFLTYGFLGELWPVFGLHIILLPLNVVRIHQLRRLSAIAQRVDDGTFPAKEILPYGRLVTFSAGQTIFAAGDHADAFYFLVSGDATVQEAGVAVGAGEIVGEIGLFTDEKLRTATVTCVSDVEAVQVSSRDLWRVFRKDPAASFELTRVVVCRLVENQRRLSASR